MADITVQELGPHGEGIDDIVFTTLVGLTNTFVNDGQTILLIKNTDGSPTTLTVSSIEDPYGRGGGGDNDLIKVLPAGDITEVIAMTGFLNTSLWAGTVDFDLNSITACSAAAVRIRR